MAGPQQNTGGIKGGVANLTNAGKGRPKGALNKATADIKALAQVHAVKAMEELARLALEAESDAARVAAIKELFDRGFGKARQGIDLDAKLDVSWMADAMRARARAAKANEE